MMTSAAQLASRFSLAADPMRATISLAKDVEIGRSRVRRIYRNLELKRR
jgi:hypothetical protein